MIKSSNGSSGLTVVKFSCKIPIFFSLSHPDGLKEKKKIFKIVVRKDLKTDASTNCLPTI